MAAGAGKLLLLLLLLLEAGHGFLGRKQKSRGSGREKRRGKRKYAG